MLTYDKKIVGIRIIFSKQTFLKNAKILLKTYVKLILTLSNLILSEQESLLLIKSITYINQGSD